MVVGTIVAFTVLACGAFLNYLINTHEKNRRYIGGYLTQYRQESLNIQCNPCADMSIKNETCKYFSTITIPDHKHDNEGFSRSLGVIAFFLLSSVRLTSFILRQSCLPKSNSVSFKSTEHNHQLEMPMSTNIYQSVATQVSINMKDES